MSIAAAEPFQQYLSEESVDVKIRSMLVENLHGNFFGFINSSINCSKTSVPFKI